MHQRSHPARLLGVLGWLVVGVLGGIGLLGLLTIGVVLLATAGVLAAALVHRRLGAEWGSGMLLGLAAATAFIAWLNQGGPGAVCGTQDDSLWCSEAWDPRPWFVATLVLTGMAVGLYVLQTRPGPAADERAQR